MVLGVNEQRVGELAGRPFVFQGLVGAVDEGGRVHSWMQGIAGRLARSFGLRGWCSLDAMWSPAGDALKVLELNPRPPASLAVYGALRASSAHGGLIDAHLKACLHGHLPDAAALRVLRGEGRSGFLHVFARQPLVLNDDARAMLAAACRCARSAVGAAGPNPHGAARGAGVHGAAHRPCRHLPRGLACRV